MNQKIKIFKNTGEIADEVAATLQSLAQKSNGKQVHIALSGGSTPKAIFQYLTERFGKVLANPHFHFWWGDDRCVDPHNDDSNFKWANDLWLSPIGISLENIHRVWGENNPVEEAIRYGREIEKYLPSENALPVFDLMLLGLGEDGHTASIFPSQMELLKSTQICAVATHPETGQKRISVTGPVINNSKVIAFLATGAKKAKKVKEIIIDHRLDLPAAHIQSQNGQLVWWLDNEAANML